MKEFLKGIVPFSWRRGLRRAEPYIRDLFSRRGGNTCCVTYQGFQLYYNCGNALIARIRSQKEYEPELSAYLVQTLSQQPKPILVDVGANIGLISLSVLRQAPGVSIYAFEPSPLPRRFLSRTIAANKLSSTVKLFEYALGEQDGTMAFVVHHGTNAAKDGFMDTGRAGEARPITVPVTTLDHWWKNEGKPAVSAIKIDTEGAELMVLRGSTEVLKVCRPVVYFELEARNIAAYPYTSQDLLSFFIEHRYRVETLVGESVSVERADFFMQQQDMFVAHPL